DEGKEKPKDVPVKEMPVSLEPPHPRFNASLAVQNDVLYIYGGTFEKDDREFTFNDLYAINLEKLDGCKRIFSIENEDWVVSSLLHLASCTLTFRSQVSEDEDEDDEDEDDEEYEEEETDEEIE